MQKISSTAIAWVAVVVLLSCATAFAALAGVQGTVAGVMFLVAMSAVFVVLAFGMANASGIHLVKHARIVAGAPFAAASVVLFLTAIACSHVFAFVSGLRR